MKLSSELTHNISDFSDSYNSGVVPIDECVLQLHQQATYQSFGLRMASSYIDSLLPTVARAETINQLLFS